ncbi:hypothetical protein CBF45_16570 [Bordetella sp. J329]|nr:hypothetical protein CBF45_16570 [Bordetella sp. J329]
MPGGIGMKDSVFFHGPKMLLPASICRQLLRRLGSLNLIVIEMTRPSQTRPARSYVRPGAAHAKLPDPAGVIISRAW